MEETKPISAEEYIKFFEAGYKNRQQRRGNRLGGKNRTVVIKIKEVKGGSMAEERIICLQIGSYLRNCPLMKNSGYCILDCGCDQLEGVKCNKGFTRTEAIERMAKKMCEEDTGVKWGKNGVVYQHIYKDLAKSALDALIKGE